MTAPTFSVVMLAGALRPSELQAALGVPPVCLPISPGRTLLQLWCERFAAVPGFLGGLVALSSPQEVASVRAALPPGCPLTPVADPRPWRGMAGLLRDLRSSVPVSDVLVAVEAGVLPPDDLAVLLAPLAAGEVDFTVGADASGEAIGAYALRMGLLERVRDVGYRDLKEQFLPELHEDGVAVHSVVLGERIMRIRRLAGYLEAIQHLSENGGSAAIGAIGANGGGPGGVANEPVRRWVRSLIAPSATVSENAVVADAVVLDGAMVGAGAVVSRSIVGPGAVVSEGARLIGRILAEPGREGSFARSGSS